MNWWELVIAFLSCDLVSGLIVAWFTLRFARKGTTRA